LIIKFELVGPGHELCPKCSLFLGDLEVFSWEEKKYHSRCVCCEFCKMKLVGTGISAPFKIRTKEFVSDSSILTQSNDILKTLIFFDRFDFTCFKCYEKKYGDSGSCIIVDSGTGVTGSRFTINSPHIWEKSESLSAVNWCGFCGESFLKNLNLKKNLKSDGYICTVCKYYCHTECMNSVPRDCANDNKIPISGESTGTMGRSIRKTLKSKAKSVDSRKGVTIETFVNPNLNKETKEEEKEKHETIDVEPLDHGTSPKDKKIPNLFGKRRETYSAIK